MAGFTMTREQLRDYLWDLEFSQVIGMVTTGTEVWLATAAAVHAKHYYTDLVRDFESNPQRLKEDPTFVYGSLIAARDAADDLFTKHCNVLWKMLKESNADWPPEEGLPHVLVGAMQIEQIEVPVQKGGIMSDEDIKAYKEQYERRQRGDDD